MENISVLIKEYYDRLTNQFMVARGIQTDQVSSIEFVNEFRDWLKNMQLIGIEYINFLNKLKLEYHYSNTAEIGKSEYDSVVANKTKTTLITPYSKGLTCLDNPLIKAKFYIDEDGIPNIEPLKKVVSDSYNNLIKLFWAAKHSIFMYQNPISKFDLMGWEELHNSGLNNIIIGAYGRADDRDMLIKLALIKEIKSRLWGNYFEENYIDQKRYLYVLASRPLNSRVIKFD